MLEGSGTGTRPTGQARLGLIAGVALLVAVGAGVALRTPREAPKPPASSASAPAASAPAPSPVAPSASELRRQLNATYVENEDPAPPAECLETDAEALALLVRVAPLLSERVPEAEKAGKAAAALQALRSRGQRWKPEGWYHVARASVEARQIDEAAMNSARLCPGFTAAENVAARMAAMAGDWEASEALNAKVAEMDTNYWKPRYHLAIMYIQDERYEEALTLLERASQLAPNNGEVHFFLGHMYLVRSKKGTQKEEDVARDEELAWNAYCRALALGHPKAGQYCKE